MTQDRLSRRELAILLTVAAAQLLVILDTTVVNIAIPLASRQLGLGADGQQWVITAYSLAFGAVLLTGGRVADYWGRKRSFLLGVLLFVGASAWGGLAGTGGELLAARAVQGASAALMAPAALSILTTTFASGRARTIAFASIGAIMSSGAGVGLILGGVLTQFAGWRWCLLVNVPVGLLAACAGALVLREGRVSGPARYDFVGAVTVALGFASVVYGLTLLQQTSTVPPGVAFAGLGVLLLAAFVLIERRVRQPLLPLGIVLERTRGGALIVQLCSGTAMITVTLYITLHLQGVLHFSPLLSGVATVPLAVAIAVAMPFIVRLLIKVGPTPILIPAPLVAGAGILLLSRITPGGSYWVQVLPGLLVMGVGMAGVFASVQNVALFGVDPADAGAASAASNAANQIGGAVGLAALTNVFIIASSGGTSSAALDDGYSAVFVGAAGVMLLASIVGAFLIRAPRSETSPDAAAAAARPLEVH